MTTEARNVPADPSRRMVKVVSPLLLRRRSPKKRGCEDIGVTTADPTTGTRATVRHRVGLDVAARGPGVLYSHRLQCVGAKPRRFA
jgi:hypothetical protein